jgi:hypothetical protein
MVPLTTRQQTPAVWTVATPRARRMALAVAVAMALAAGAVAGATQASTGVSDADFLILVRFMAFVKALIALAAAALVAWRFGLAIARPLSAAYIASVSLMALAPGLIWYEALLPLASAAFHSGLLLGLALAAGDGMAKRRA